MFLRGQHVSGMAYSWKSILCFLRETLILLFRKRSQGKPQELILQIVNKYNTDTGQSVQNRPWPLFLETLVCQP